MTIKRNRGLTSFDLVLPVASQMMRNLDTARTTAASRWARDDYSESPSRFRQNKDSANNKIDALARPRLEILRANSPTLKRLLAARTKLEKIANVSSRNYSASRQSLRSTRETSYPYNNEKTAQQGSSMPSSHVAAAAAPVSKQLQSSSSLANAPLDKITYEKTWTNTGNVKQKCSLEIWLPKANVDDEEDRATSQSMTPDSHTLEKKSPPVANNRSRRSSIIKINTTTVTNIEPNLTEEQVVKRSEPIRPRIYHYADYIMDPNEERPRSSKSVTTVKSDGTGSIKSVKRHNNRSQTRRQSVSTNHSEEILRFTTTEVPNTGKNASSPTRATQSNNEKKTPSRPSNPSMITELMHKYSLMKKNHQELIQARLHLEKPSYEIKVNTTSNYRTDSNGFRPPAVPDSTSLVPPEHPSVSVKKLLLDTSITHSTSNGKLLERRGTPRKASYGDGLSQSRVFPLTSHQQHRQLSATTQMNAVMPTVVDMPNDSFNSGKGSSRYASQFESSSASLGQYSMGSGIGTIDQTPSRFSRRSIVTVRPQPAQQQRQKQDTSPLVQLVQNSAQRYRHFSTTRQVPTNKVLVQFNANNHRHNDRQCLVPD